MSSEVLAQNKEVLSKHAKTFFLASLFLPREVAQDASSLYRFAREVDDMVDEFGPVEASKNILSLRREMEQGSYAQFPFLKDFRETQTKLGIPDKYVAELVDGVAWDTENSVVLDEEAFYIYCYQVAGVVGLMMCFVLRINDSRAYSHATDLGIAMQITNICRDIVEDAHRGRMYLPLNQMDSVILNESNIGSRAFVPLLKRNIISLLQQAEKHYESADQGLCYIPWRARFAILVAAKLYRAIGLKILKNPEVALQRRVYVSTLEKTFWLLFCCIYFFHPRIWRKPPSGHQQQNYLPAYIRQRLV